MSGNVIDFKSKAQIMQKDNIFDDLTDNEIYEIDQAALRVANQVVTELQSIGLSPTSPSENIETLRDCTFVREVMVAIILRRKGKFHPLQYLIDDLLS